MEGECLWGDWLTRWDRFQETYVPHREEQFDVMLDYVGLWWNTGPVRALDLGCGPGSLASRLLHRMPDAEVVGLDYDPWLLEMGRQTLGSSAGEISWVEADLRETKWTKMLRQEFQVVLSATTLHRFDAQELRQIYGGVATILVPNGLFLNADIFPAGSARVSSFAREMLVRWQARRLGQPDGESWYAFWREARGEPCFAELIAERDRRLEPRAACQAAAVEFHRELLLRAGFRDVGEIWRWHESAILLAIR